MKIWYDTEFMEDGERIILLSIGMVAEDGRELYFENADADRTKANPWVMEHIIPQLSVCRMADIAPKDQTVHDIRCDCPVRPMVIIRMHMEEFCNPAKYGKPEFWGYYSAYDHVALCQIFGKMIDLPKDWPMYTNDIKQWAFMVGNPQLPSQDSQKHHALADARWNRSAFDFLKFYSAE